MERIAHRVDSIQTPFRTITDAVAVAVDHGGVTGGTLGQAADGDGIAIDLFFVADAVAVGVGSAWVSGIA